MDVGSNGSYPGNALSNFAAHEFYLDGVRCASMEGFLQSLKFENPAMQEHICSLIGIGAKRAGQEKNWQKHQKLFWRGQVYPRRSREYQMLLDRAYLALYTNKGFRAALKAAGDAVFTISVGQEDAVPLGRHRNAHENTLGTLYSNIAPKMLDLQTEII